MNNIIKFLAQCMVNNDPSNLVGDAWHISTSGDIEADIKSVEAKIARQPVVVRSICDEATNAYQYRAYHEGIKAGIALVVEALRS